MLLHRLRYYRLRSEEVFRILPHKTQSFREHAQAALDWILRAADITPDGGVAQLYDALSRQWAPSYPETTGYIIPSLLAAAQRNLLDPNALRNAALRMGRWLLTLQHQDGSFPAGPIGANQSRPSVFNTGQILWGLTTLIHEFPESANAFMRAAKQAADWLISQQDPDGAWRRGVSPYTEGPFHAYYVYAARALALYGRQCHHSEATNAAKRNAEFVLSLATPSGWIREMGFSPGNQALLHTVAYTLQGLFDVGRWTEIPSALAAAETAARRLLSLQDAKSGALPGRITTNFVADVRWSSTPANAQIAILWYDLAEFTGDVEFARAAERALLFNCSLQELHHRNPARRGALRGNFPTLPGYGCGQYFSWTQKFFVDALLKGMAHRTA